MFLLFYFLHSNVPDKCHKKKWGMLFFTHIKLASATTHIKWIRLHDLQTISWVWSILITIPFDMSIFQCFFFQIGDKVLPKNSNFIETSFMGIGKIIFLHSYFKLFLNKLYMPKISVEMVPKGMFLLGSTVFQIKNKLQTLVTEKFSSYLKIDFTSTIRVKSFFTIKDKFHKMLQSRL